LQEEAMTHTARFHALGGPEVLRLEEEQVRAPGPGEVRVKVEAIGLNRAELAFMADRYLEHPVLPARLGYEAAGTIEATGPDVAGWKIGDRVTVVPAFSMNEYGTAAELTVVPARALVAWPEGLSAVEAASVTMQYITAWAGCIASGRWPWAMRFSSPPRRRRSGSPPSR
jgi:NADPH:quinone reductase-like Zn-dependent oxidoreductase